MRLHAVSRVLCCRRRAAGASERAGRVRAWQTDGAHAAATAGNEGERALTDQESRRAMFGRAYGPVSMVVTTRWLTTGRWAVEARLAWRPPPLPLPASASIVLGAGAREEGCARGNQMLSAAQVVGAKQTTAFNTEATASRPGMRLFATKTQLRSSLARSVTAANEIQPRPFAVPGHAGRCVLGRVHGRSCHHKYNPQTALDPRHACAIPPGMCWALSP